MAAYLTLLTPRYPPFRLDQGGAEPGPSPGDPHPASPLRPARTATVAGAVAALVAGVLLLAPAAGLGTGGVVLLALDAGRDSAGYVSSPALQLTSTTAAITAENLTIADADLWTRDVADVGGLRVTATSPTSKTVFVGIAPQAAVDAWLAGTAHDELTGLTNGTADYSRAVGSVRAAADPAAQPFWRASATGPGDATLQWRVESGEYAVVVANADGSPGVSADVRGAVQVPELTALGGGLLAAGVVLGLLGVGLIVLGGVGLGRRHSEPSPDGPPPAGPIGPAPEHVPPMTGGS